MTASVVYDPRLRKAGNAEKMELECEGMTENNVVIVKLTEYDYTSFPLRRED
jgi:hypothetical protein